MAGALLYRRKPVNPIRREALLEVEAAAARACTRCAQDLPLGPRPVLRVSATARLLIMSQAPGSKVHETGLSFDDRSGDRLRDWLQVSRHDFYDESRIAVIGNVAHDRPVAIE